MLLTPLERGEDGAFDGASRFVEHVGKDPRPAGARFIGAPLPYFLRIYGGVGMHAGYLPGYAASHGCIRMPAGQARRFYGAAPIGTPVIIRD